MHVNSNILGTAVREYKSHTRIGNLISGIQSKVLMRNPSRPDKGLLSHSIPQQEPQFGHWQAAGALRRMPPLTAWVRARWAGGERPARPLAPASWTLEEAGSAWCSEAHCPQCCRLHSRSGRLSDTDLKKMSGSRCTNRSIYLLWEER